MNARIVIEVDDADGDFGVTVDVSGDLDTLQTIGLFDIAKQQHLQSKHVQGPTVYAEQAPTEAIAAWHHLPLRGKDA